MKRLDHIVNQELVRFSKELHKQLRIGLLTRVDYITKLIYNDGLTHRAMKSKYFWAGHKFYFLKGGRRVVFDGNSVWT